MDRFTIDRDNIIERFILGQLTDAELDAFLTYQLFHPEIKTEVDALRALVKSARPPKNAPSVKWWQKTGFRTGLALAAVSAALVLWYLATRHHRAVDQPAPAIQQQQPAAPLLPPADTAATQPGRPENRQIAADFRPNPRLESMLGPGRFRGSAEEQPVWVKTPRPVQHCSGGASDCHFRLNGSLHGAAATIKMFRWLLFSNKPADYTALRPLRTGSFSLQNNPDQTVGIDAQIGLRLSPGLYYYLIEDEESGAIYFIGKLTVN